MIFDNIHKLNMKDKRRVYYRELKISKRNILDDGKNKKLSDY